MNGMWLTLAAEVLDRSKLPKLQMFWNVGTASAPQWELSAEAAGIRQVTGRKGSLVTTEFTPIPDLSLQE